ncbi:MAG: hypothetical protein JSW52_09940, partial [Candidatus Coatesbacteria bacterium]
MEGDIITLAKILASISVFVSFVTFPAALSSGELPIGEMTPIGEVGGVTYLATPHEPDPAGTSFEINTKAGNIYEKIAELVVPAADDYYAGVSPDGEYYFVAGDNEPLGPYEPIQFFYVYKKGNAEPAVVSTSVIDGFCAWEFAWSSDKLYAVANIGSETLQGDILYEIDSVAGTVKGILSAHSIELPGEG